MPREVLQLRDAADIRHAVHHVATQRRAPRFEISTERFPWRFTQRAQHQLTQLTEGCNCLLGEVLAGTTLLFGLFWVWTVSRGWRELLQVLAAVLVVGSIGKLVELLSARARMVWVLRNLERRINTPDDPDPTLETLAARYGSSQWDTALAAFPAGAARPARRKAPGLTPRPKVQIARASDINRLLLQVLASWTLPRIEIEIDGLAPLPTQRAQHRYTRLTDGTSFMLAGLFAGLMLLVGLLIVLKEEIPKGSPAEDLASWFNVLEWSDVQPWLLAMLLAGVAGWFIELLVTRLRLLLVLLQLRWQARPRRSSN